MQDTDELYPTASVTEWTKNLEQLNTSPASDKVATTIIECRPVQQADLYLTFTWPSLQRRRNYLICTLVYKCLNNLAPNYLLSDFKRTQEFHTYNTRCKDSLRPPRAKTTKYQGSFRINGACTWNALPPQIRKEISFSAFKAKLKHISKSTNWVVIHMYFFFFFVIHLL